MTFTQAQERLLRRKPAKRHVRTRQVKGKELAYLEGAYAIEQANRIFGFDGWSRETLDVKCLRSTDGRQEPFALYTARVRLTVLSGDRSISRDGLGIGEGRGGSFAEAHELALKTAETDATKRALATFGKAFGLALRIDAAPLHRGEESEQHRGSQNCAKPALTGVENAMPTEEPKPSEAAGSQINGNLKPPRIRSREHLAFVASQPCLICGKSPADAHHVKFAQPRALGKKVSDEFTVPLCRLHHMELHNSGNERNWWHNYQIDPLGVAKRLWISRSGGGANAAP